MRTTPTRPRIRSTLQQQPTGPTATAPAESSTRPTTTPTAPGPDRRAQGSAARARSAPTVTRATDADVTGSPKHRPALKNPWLPGAAGSPPRRGHEVIFDAPKTNLTFKCGAATDSGANGPSQRWPGPVPRTLLAETKDLVSALWTSWTLNDSCGPLVARATIEASCRECEPCNGKWLLLWESLDGGSVRFFFFLSLHTRPQGSLEDPSQGTGGTCWCLL